VPDLNFAEFCKVVISNKLKLKMIRKSDSTDADNQLTAFQTPTPVLRQNSPRSTLKDTVDFKAAQAPHFTPKRVMGNGAFGKYNYTELN
jgi:hypothetical protein